MAEARGPRRALDLGAGTKGVAGAIRADLARASRPDVVLDANRPLPFRTGSLSRVWCFDVVEHLDDLPAVMGEIHRVLVPGGTALITVPHFSCANAFTDPTHRHWFGWRSFDYFTPEHTLRYYSSARFRIVRRVLHFSGGPVDAVVRRLAARWPEFYERRLTWIFPAWYLECELQSL